MEVFFKPWTAAIEEYRLMNQDFHIGQLSFIKTTIYAHILFVCMVCECQIIKFRVQVYSAYFHIELQSMLSVI